LIRRPPLVDDNVASYDVIIARRIEAYVDTDAFIAFGRAAGDRRGVASGIRAMLDPVVRRLS